MRMFGRVLVTAVCIAGLVVGGAAPALADEKGNLVDFSSMTPIPVGGMVVRGVIGGGLPWAITSGTGTVSQRGEVDVTVTGLVLAGSGVNPIPKFEAIVSCIGADGLPHNVTTGGFAATVPGGNSHISATVDLPRPCKDPIVFVGLFPAGRWFAMSNADAQP